MIKVFKCWLCSMFQCIQFLQYVQYVQCGQRVQCILSVQCVFNANSIYMFYDLDTEYQNETSKCSKHSICSMCIQCTFILHDLWFRYRVPKWNVFYWLIQCRYSICRYWICIAPCLATFIVYSIYLYLICMYIQWLAIYP